MGMCLLVVGTRTAESASGYQLAVELETEQYRQLAEYDPHQVRFRLTISGYSDSTDVPACTELFKGSISVDFEITMQNGSTVKLNAGYQSATGFSWTWTWSPFISMTDDLWILRVSKITANPVATFTAVDNLHLIRKRSLLLAIHSDYYSKFPEDMPHFAEIIGETYEHMVSLTGIRTPTAVVLSTLYRCTTAKETASYVTVLPPRFDYSPFSQYMREDGFIAMIFHEMAHSIMTSNNCVWSSQGPSGYRNWFNEGLAEYMGTIEVPAYFGSRADEFLSRNLREFRLVASTNIFSILLGNKGNITDNEWRTTSDAGKLLQQAGHPESEAAGMLRYFEENYRPDFVRYFYKYTKELWDGLPPIYQTWSQVWTSQVDPYARDTVIVNLLSKAVCANLTSFLSENLSFQLYNLNQLQTQLAPDPYNSYISVIDGESTFLSLPPTAARPEKNVTLAVSIEDSVGDHVANQQVDFYVGSSYDVFIWGHSYIIYTFMAIGSNSTDLNGTAIVTTQLPASSARIVACCGGTSGYAASLNQTNVKMLNFADVNEDGTVNIVDISTVAKAFSAHGPDVPNPGDPASQSWNPLADLNSDNTVNILDVTVVAKEFGKTT